MRHETTCPARRRVEGAGIALAAALAAVAAIPAPALASDATGRAARAQVRSQRTSEPIVIDGSLTDEAWLNAPVFDAFVQSYPYAGTAPSQRTELRVLYDATHIYFGVHCGDARPDEINGRLGKRDAVPVSDRVTVAIDSTLSGTSAYAFTVNAGGVLEDGLYTNDIEYVREWDAVWDGAASRTPRGWAVEIAVPLDLLRFPDAPLQTWGIGVRRQIARNHEIIDTAVVASDANAMVSRFAHLTDLQALRPARKLVLEPYIATRVIGLPAAEVGGARAVAPSADLGLDAKIALASDLDLSLTVNPDFGQVEADEVVLNVTSFEVEFPEKRPFFNEGLDLFRPIDADMPQVFYSRRIGLDAPILAAAKLSGTVAAGWEVGLLDALVAGPSRPAGAAADYDLHWERPLHLGRNDELPASPPVTKNFAVATVRGQPAPSLDVGGIVASGMPLSEPCDPSTVPPGEADTAECLAPRGGTAAAVHGIIRSPDSEWVALGQVYGSHTSIESSEPLVLRDGTLLRDGDTGLGLFARGGKYGGEPWRLKLGYEYLDDTLDLDTTGFVRAQNQQSVSADVGLVRTNALGLREVETELKTLAQWSADGAGVSLGRKLVWLGEIVTGGYYRLGTDVLVAFDRNDLREIAGAGVAFERPNYAQYSLYGATNPNQSATATAAVFVGLNGLNGITPTRPFGGVEASGGVKIGARNELALSLSAIFGDSDGPRWVETSGGAHIFSDLRSSQVSLTLRHTTAFSQQLALQLYSQLFTAYGAYGQYYQHPTGHADIALDDLMPMTYTGDDADFQLAALTLNAVLRWEYRKGSSAFLVYSREQLASRTGRSLVPSGLADGETTDVVLLKWSYWWKP